MLWPVLVSGQHDLLGAARLGLAEIYALLHMRRGTFGLQPEAEAGGGAQQHGFAILLHGVVLNPVAKALLLTAVAAIGSFVVSGFVLRKSPLRAII